MNKEELKIKYDAFVADLKKRVADTKTTRWWRFGIVAAIFIAWVAWLGNWWVILWLLLLFDIYITGYIPFTWWKKSKNKMTVMVMSWVDAIVYALILVYFVFSFIGQNYQIPSSSLEKTLLTGDYLWVSKISYGPRVPMTPIHFPLVQNTLPGILGGGKSYTEWPSWGYHRLKGLGSVQQGDIVVFNFPAGDTITLKQQNPDYYTLQKVYGDTILTLSPELAEPLVYMTPEERRLYRNAIGTRQIESESDFLGEIMYRPVDRRENYVKRAVALPGQTIKIVDGQIYIDGVKQKTPTTAQFNYDIVTSSPITDNQWEQLEVALDDRRQKGYNLYEVPLTPDMKKKLEGMGNIVSVTRTVAPKGEYMFPEGISDNWTRADYGPLWIPQKGKTIQITPENWLIYHRIIRNYEGHTNSYVRDGKVYIDGKPADTYTFAMDYYFMMGDNRDNSLDSRYWGFVPEDHIVGKPIRVLISFDKDKSIFNGGIRWNRIFKDANPGL